MGTAVFLVLALLVFYLVRVSSPLHHIPGPVVALLDQHRLAQLGHHGKETPISSTPIFIASTARSSGLEQTLFCSLIRSLSLRRAVPEGATYPASISTVSIY